MKQRGSLREANQHFSRYIEAFGDGSMIEGVRILDPLARKDLSGLLGVKP